MKAPNRHLQLMGACVGRARCYTGRMIQLLLAAALSAHAADAYKVLEPRAVDGKMIAYRMIRYEVPANTPARILLSLAPVGDCFDASGVTWTKGEAGEKKLHSINFDPWVLLKNGKRPEVCTTWTCPLRKAESRS